MCQAAPGPRCYADSSRKIHSLESRYNNAQKALKQAETDLNKASTYKDYEKTRLRVGEAKTVVKEIETKLRHAQRDLDSTKTGARLLEEARKNATSTRELAVLENRRKAAEAKLFARKTALELKLAGRPPMIKFA